MPISLATIELSRIVLPSAPWSASESAIPASSFPSTRRPCTTLRAVPGLSWTPYRNWVTRPFVIVTSSWPLLRMPASSPRPSTTWPSRSMVMPGAPTMRPWPPQSTRSLSSLVLRVRIWPQETRSATGGGPTVQAYIFVSKLLAASVARTQNSWSPVARPVYVFGEVHAGAVDQSRTAPALTRRHWKVTPLSRFAENSNVALVSTVTLSGVESIESLKSPSCTAHVWLAGVGSGLPEKSTARTSNVYVSLTRLLYVLGLVQGCQADSSVPSNRHSNVTGLALSAPVDRNTATLSVPGSSGVSG